MLACSPFSATNKSHHWMQTASQAIGCSYAVFSIFRAITIVLLSVSSLGYTCKLNSTLLFPAWMDVTVRNIISTRNYKFDIHFPWILSTICLKLTSMHTIATEFSRIRKLTQECQNHKETSLNGGICKYEHLLHKAKTNQMKSKWTNWEK